MTAQQADRMRDLATIAQLEETSHSGDPREFLRTCLHCEQPFWVRVAGTHGGEQLYCSDSHRTLRYYYAHRAHALARQKRYQARRRAERVA